MLARSEVSFVREKTLSDLLTLVSVVPCWTWIIATCLGQESVRISPAYLNINKQNLLDTICIYS